MTLEFLELMEDMKSEELKVNSEKFAAAAQDSTKGTTRRKLQRSFKSNTRIYDDGSIEVDPQAQGEPSQKDVKKVGKSKRYVTNGKNPLTCVELKCPENVPDKAAFFHKDKERQGFCLAHIRFGRICWNKERVLHSNQ